MGLILCRQKEGPGLRDTGLEFEGENGKNGYYTPPLLRFLKCFNCLLGLVQSHFFYSNVRNPSLTQSILDPRMAGSSQQLFLQRMSLSLSYFVRIQCYLFPLVSTSETRLQVLSPSLHRPHTGRNSYSLASFTLSISSVSCC